VATEKKNPDVMSGAEQLVEVFTIASKYGDKKWITHCEHDEMWLCIDGEKVSEEDKKRLDELGFFEDDGGFKSYRHGSC
jgi:hypothetical protein